MERYGPSCDTDQKFDIGLEYFILGLWLADQIRTLVRYVQGGYSEQHSSSSRVFLFVFVYFASDKTH